MSVPDTRKRKPTLAGLALTFAPICKAAQWAAAVTIWRAQIQTYSAAHRASPLPEAVA